MAERVLKYPFAFDSNGSIVSADEIAKKIAEGTAKSEKFYNISLRDDNGETVTKKLILINSVKKRKHFRELTDNKSENTVKISTSSYNETVIHGLTKQMLCNKEIDELFLPSATAYFERGSLNIKNERYMYLLDKKIDTEVLYEDKETGEKFKFDTVITDNQNKTIIVEIKVTHPVDDRKIEFIRKYNLDAVEIDLSDLNIKGYIVERNLKEQICSILKQSNNNIKWLNNSEVSEIKQCINDIANVKMDKTSYKKDRDGGWFVYANDEKLKGKLKMCPYYDKLDNNHSKLYERECADCPRLLRVRADKKCINCYHGTVELDKLYDVIYSLDTISN